MSWFNWLSSEEPSVYGSVAVVESVTAGALCNAICAKPGSIRYFLGGICAYGPVAKKNLLNIGVAHTEMRNHATAEMSRIMAAKACKLLNSHCGLSTVGYSLPYHREATPTQCALAIDTPYAWYTLYDSKRDHYITNYVEFPMNDTPAGLHRATVQTKVALLAANLYFSYIHEFEEVV